ncbi:TolC family protein [Fulvivirga sedimenti]|uniref:TolC family protein n=1 Tax=Fulvivirga sedimenti TaxID=2879465 RepID=A0A9X1KUY6_9BACT|nr:TolC family protein [Fulvivirga sedimenti]MCA6074073.1 TolC family protein [Fulvivirga sedimenti]
MKRIIITLVFSILSSQAFCQAELNRLLITAAENHAGLASQSSAIEAARERLNRSGTWEDPRISAGYFIQPIETRNGPQRWRFSISQMFPWFGTRDVESDLYSLMADIEYLRWVDEREKLFLELRTEYFALWSLRQKIILNEEQDQILENLEALAETRFASGSGKLRDFNRIRMSRQRVQNEIEIQQGEFIARYQALLREVQAPIDTLLFDDEFSISLTSPVIPDSIAMNPGYQLLKAREESARLEQEMIRQRGKPGIGAGLDYIIVGKRDDMMIADNGRNALMPMVTMTLPIWRRKINSARKEAEWKEEEFKSASRQFQISRQAELELVLFEMEKSIRNMGLSEDQLSLLNQTLELAETDFANDQASLYDLLLIQEDILNFEKEKVQALENYLSARATYEYLTWQEAYTSLKDLQDEKE